MLRLLQWVPLLLVWAAVASVDGAAQLRGYTNVPISNLMKAMVGFDPIKANPLGKDDGTRGRIFEPIKAVVGNGYIRLNPFIDQAQDDLRCSLDMQQTRSRNFQEYHEREFSSISYENGADVSVSVGVPGFEFGPSFGFSIGRDEEEEQILKLFESNAAEIIQTSFQCFTHIVSISPYVLPVFQPAFLSGVRQLYVASKNPSSEYKDQTFKQFVNNYGTHFMATANLGAWAVYENRFTTKESSSSSSSSRMKCASDAAHVGLNVAKWGVSVETTFSHSSSKCHESSESDEFFSSNQMKSEKVISVGSMPTDDRDEWLSSVRESPLPIRYKLQKISKLFKYRNFDSILLNDQEPDGEKLNGTWLESFFEEQSSRSCQIMFNTSNCYGDGTGCGYNDDCDFVEKCFNTDEGEGFVCRKGCGYTDNCKRGTKCVSADTLLGFTCQEACGNRDSCRPGTKCINTATEVGFICKDFVEKSTKRYSKIVVAGGRAHLKDWWGRSYYLDSVEVMSGRSINKLYRDVYGQTATIYGPYVYMFGGRQRDWLKRTYTTHDTYRIRLDGSDRKWKRMKNLPKAMAYHTAVSMSGKIWLVGNGRIYSYDISRNSYHSYWAPFKVYEYGKHCAVGNGTHSFVIGVGSNRREIWVNTRSKDPSSWRKVATMANKRERHACLWYGGSVLITGGSYDLGLVEVFDTRTYKVWKTGRLQERRLGHQMMVYDGQPAVIGGWSGSGIYFRRSIETYNLDSYSWKVVGKKLGKGREDFALAQETLG